MHPVPAPDRPTARSMARHPAFAFFCAYALFVVYATLLPFQFMGDPELLRQKARWINWDPRYLVNGEPTPITDLVMNVAFFVPLGVIGFHAQRRRRAAVAVLRATGAGLLLTLGVETLQFFTPSRNPATSDLLTNTFGAACGAVLAALLRVQFQGVVRKHAFSWMRREPLLPVLVGYVVLIAVSALVPFDLAFSVSDLKRALRNARLDPWSDPAPLWKEAQVVLQYGVLAAVAYHVSAKLRFGPRFVRGIACFAFAGLLAFGLETLQIVVRSRVTAARDVLAAFAGAGFGVVFAAVLGIAGIRHRAWSIVTIAYVAWLVIDALQPFQFRYDPATLRSRITYTALIPYSTYYYKANLAAIADFLDTLLGYVPLAFVVSRRWFGCRWRDGLRPGLQIAMVCALVAFVLETLQLGIPRRYAEISDVLTAALGGVLGAYAWRWMAHLERASEVATPQTAAAGTPEGTGRVDRVWVEATAPTSS